jgi:hypothetical protein
MPQYDKCPKCGNPYLAVFTLGNHEQIFCESVYHKGCNWYGKTERLGYYKLIGDTE